MLLGLTWWAYLRWPWADIVRKGCMKGCSKNSDAPPFVRYLRKIGECGQDDPPSAKVKSAVALPFFSVHYRFITENSLDLSDNVKRATSVWSNFQIHEFARFFPSSGRHTKIWWTRHTHVQIRNSSQLCRQEWPLITSEWSQNDSDILRTEYHLFQPQRSSWRKLREIFWIRRRSVNFRVLEEKIDRKHISYLTKTKYRVWPFVIHFLHSACDLTAGWWWCLEVSRGHNPRRFLEFY